MWRENSKPLWSVYRRLPLSFFQPKSLDCHGLCFQWERGWGKGPNEQTDKEVVGNGQTGG